MTVKGIPHERPDEPEKLGLPVVTFFYTLDQIAVMLALPEEELTNTRIYFVGRSRGRLQSRQIKAVNIALDPETDAPDWRVTQGEFIRWLKLMGVKVYSRGRVI